MEKTTQYVIKVFLLLTAVLLACLATYAQRGDRSGRGSSINRNEMLNPQRSRTPIPGTLNTPNQQRSTNPGINRNSGPVSRNFYDRVNSQPPAIRSAGQTPNRTFSERPASTNSRQVTRENHVPDIRDRVTPAPSTNISVNRNVIINRNNNYYGSGRGNYSPGNVRNASPFRYTYHYPNYGQRFTSLHFNYNMIPFGGSRYCYYGGVFYRPFGSYFQVVAPPIGISINILPFGYTRFYLGSIPYYFYGNVFYRRYNNYYQVVDPPLGAKLPALPGGAEEVIIDGQRYFENHGTFYFEEFNEKNQRLYTVVGVDGVLDKEQVERIIGGPAVFYENGTGDIYSELPFDSHKIKINGQDYYRSPGDVYFQEITDGNTVSYQVVGG